MLVTFFKLTQKPYRSTRITALSLIGGLHCNNYLTWRHHCAYPTVTVFMDVTRLPWPLWQRGMHSGIITWMVNGWSWQWWNKPWCPPWMGTELVLGDLSTMYYSIYMGTYRTIHGWLWIVYGSSWHGWCICVCVCMCVCVWCVCGACVCGMFVHVCACVCVVCACVSLRMCVCEYDYVSEQCLKIV